MTAGVREQMADAAARLLAEEGYQATSFRTVIDASGAPRGSIYHHFPGGKDELVEFAIDRQADRVIAGLERLAGRDPRGIVDGFGSWWRRSIEATDFAVGCSLLAVGVSAEPGPLRARSGELFHDWIQALAGLLLRAGVTDDAARGFAAELLAALEGAVAISRAQRSFDVFDAVLNRLRATADTLPKSADTLLATADTPPNTAHPTEESHD